MNSRSKIFSIAGASLTLTLASVLYIAGLNDSAVSNTAADSTSVSESTLSDTRFSQDKNLKAATQGQQRLDHANSKDSRYTGPRDQNVTTKTLSTDEYLARSAYGNLPQSLTGVSIPPLFLASDGSLEQDQSAKHFIEFFLSGAREEGRHVSYARMQEYFALVLEEPALSQAFELLDNYMNYRDQLDAVASRNDILASDQDKLSAVRDTLARRQALRRETLGEQVATAMFGDSERYEHYVVQVMHTQADETLSDDEKNALYQGYEANLPEHIRARVSYQRQLKEIEDTIHTMQSNNASAEEVYALRQSFYGEKTAEMWAFIEGNSSEWQLRVSEFEQNKKSILDSPILSEAQKRAQIEQLRQRDFDEKERLKLAWQSLK